jgi:D-3-phosphoglycerate dehydrogenase
LRWAPALLTWELRREPPLDSAPSEQEASGLTPSSSLFRIWFERNPPATYARLLEGSALIVGSGASEARAQGSISKAQAIIASSRVRYDGELMNLAPELRVISRTGIGLDNVSISDASKRGIAVCNLPEGPTVSTAEHAIALMFAVAKELPRAAQALRDGRGDFFNEYRGIELCGLRLGIIGLGRIGGRVAMFAKALGMEVTACDPFLDPRIAERVGAKVLPDLTVLLAGADVVSLHAPLKPETKDLMDANRIAEMKRGALVSNTARGGLVDEQALLGALESGHLRGAGLDVFDPEPPDPTNRLLQLDNVIATPHIAGATETSRDHLWRMAIAQALQVLRGERPPSLANPEILDDPARSRANPRVVSTRQSNGDPEDQRA